VAPHCLDTCCENCLVELFESVLNGKPIKRAHTSNLSIISDDLRPVKNHRLTLDQIVAAIMKKAAIAEEKARKNKEKEFYTHVTFKDYFKKLQELVQRKKYRKVKNQ